VQKWCPKRLPRFWVLVWSCNLCFIPNLSCSHKSGETGYQLMVCRILFWQDLIEWRIGLREGKAQVKAKSTLRSGSHVRTNLDENTKFGTLSLLLLLLSSFTAYCFHPDFWFRPQFWQNWRFLPSVWGSITLLMTQRKFLIPKFHSIFKNPQPAVINKTKYPPQHYWC
jgi:hypothetical protein